MRWSHARLFKGGRWRATRQEVDHWLTLWSERPSRRGIARTWYWMTIALSFFSRGGPAGCTACCHARRRPTVFLGRRRRRLCARRHWALPRSFAAGGRFHSASRNSRRSAPWRRDMCVRLARAHGGAVGRTSIRPWFQAGAAPAPRRPAPRGVPRGRWPRRRARLFGSTPSLVLALPGVASAARGIGQCASA